jgi:hypothetical protein
MMLRERFQLINNEEKMKYLHQIDEYKYTIKLLQSQSNQLRNELAYFKRTNNLLNHQIPKI